MRVVAGADLEPKRRSELYGEMQNLVSSDGGAIVPFFASDVCAVSDKVAFDRASNNYEVDGRMW